MIGYRFLIPAEEEMTEASLFYEAASTGSEAIILMMYIALSKGFVSIPNWDRPSHLILGKSFCIGFHSALSTQSRRTRF
jgi:hypothetical protein